MRSLRTRLGADAAADQAGYDRPDSASLIPPATAMGMLVYPPAIFMIVIAQGHQHSGVALFVAGFIRRFVHYAVG